MKTKRISLPLIAASLLLCGLLQTRADTVALTFTLGAGSGSGTATNLTAGWAFSLSSNILVTQLGAFDANNQMPLSSPPGDGLLSNQLITIWTSTGTFVASATVPAGGGTLLSGFRYVSIPPTLLTAGSYVIGDYYSPTNLDPNVEFAPIVTTAPGVNVTTATMSRIDTGNVFPTTVLSGSGVWGPNFQFTAATPEGGSSGILLAISGSLLWWQRRRAAKT